MQSGKQQCFERTYFPNILYAEDEGSMFFQIVGNHLPQYTVLLLNSSRPYPNQQHENFNSH
jgi:hypothetical protein